MKRSHRAPLAGLVAAVLLSSWTGAAGADPRLERKVSFHIEPQALDSALLEFSKQADVQLLLASKAIGEQRSRGLTQKVAANAALQSLLAGTGFTFRADGNTVTIEPDLKSSQVDDPHAAESPSGHAQLAQAEGERDPVASAYGENINVRKEDTISEIVVTAQKRAERLQDVPVPVTAISAGALIDSNQVRLQDYYTMVPGLNVTPGAQNGAPAISIRGITTGVYTNPTVAVIVDDVPYGSSSNLGGGAVVPDIDPSDLARVEVLRGPQGTLYGASSIGGLLKFVTIDPSTNSVSGQVQASGSGVYNGHEAGYGVRGSINVPLTDTWAIRASGFSRRDPGYIDNVLTGRRGVNTGNADGGRLSAMWRPASNFSLKLSGLVQNSRRDGSPEVTGDLGDLQQSTLSGTGSYDRKTQAYSATITARLGTVDVTSVSGYSVDRVSDSIDETSVLGSITALAFPVEATALFDNLRTSKFTQELRFASSVGKAVDWLIGAFYTRENSAPITSDYFAQQDAGTRTILDPAASFDWRVAYKEYAAFADFTFHFSDPFEVQVGARESQNKQSYSEIDSGALIQYFDGLPSPVLFPEVNTKASAFTYLITPQYRFSPDLMLYGRAASGYRPGGPNPSAIAFGLPLSYKPDKTQNYEIGAKGDLFDHSVSFDVSAYYIDWKDIQLSVNTPLGLSYLANGSRAKSQGLEVAVEAKPVNGLAIAGWVAWNDAVLTKSLPSNSSVTGQAGDRLPNSSRFSGNLSLEQSFPVTVDVTGYVAGDIAYVGDRRSFFQSIYAAGSERQALPGYAKSDLRIGLKSKSWNANLFATNVADKRGLLTGGAGSLRPDAFYYIQPRTVGVSVSAKF